MNKKGSLTVFAALTLMLIAQFVFVLLEAGRNVEIRKTSQMEAGAAIESVFSRYCTPLWEEYHLLATDGGDGQGEFSQDILTSIISYIDVENSEGQGNDLLRYSLVDTTVDSYTLLSDDNGDIYAKAVSTYMKDNLLYEEAQSLNSYFQSIKDMEENSKYSDSTIGTAIAALKGSMGQLKQASSESNAPLSSDNEGATTSEDNTLDVVTEKQTSGILTLVLGQNVKISSKCLDQTDLPSSRSLNKGKEGKTAETSWYERILMEDYFSSYMSCYLDKKEGRGLEYELEYLIAGKPKDEDNLKSVVNRLLAVREAVNVAYLYTSATRMAEVTTLATALAGASVNPLVIEAVKAGLIAAWAYCESILDIRALLQGDKIPVLKTDQSWTSSVTNISELLTGDAKAKASKSGLGYQEFLGLLLLFQTNKEISYRAMDLQEATLRQIEGYENIHLDNMVIDMEVSTAYEYQAIFYSNQNFKVKQKAKYYYYKL